MTNFAIIYTHCCRILKRAARDSKSPISMIELKLCENKSRRYFYDLPRSIRCTSESSASASIRITRLRRGSHMLSIGIFSTYPGRLGAPPSAPHLPSFAVLCSQPKKCFAIAPHCVFKIEVSSVHPE